MKKVLCAVLVCFQLSLFAQTNQDGIKAIEHDQFRQAEMVFNTVLRLNQATAETWYHLGELYYTIEKYDSAAMMFKKGIGLFPNSPLCYIGSGKLFLDDNKAADAKTQFGKAISLSLSKDAGIMARVAQANITARNKNIAYAKELLTQALLLDKKNAFANIVMGDAFLEENNGGMALTHYEKAIEINPQSALANFRIGQLYMRSRNSDEAMKHLNSALQIDSLYAPAYREMAELFNTMKKYDEAKNAYGKYLDISGNSTTSTLTRYAYLLFKAKDYTTTISIINLLQTMDSSNIVMNRFLAYSNYEQRKYTEGLKSMEAFLAKVDTSKILASDYEYYGKLLSKNKMDSLAVIHIGKAIAMDSTETDLYTDLGDAYKSWKKFDLAAQAYKSRIEKSRAGADALAHYKLGEAYYWNKQIDLADSAFMKVIELKPNLAIGYFWHARCLSKYPEKYLEEAKTAYEKYLEIESPSPKASKKDMTEAYEFLGFYYIQKEDNNKAKETYRQILELDPENENARKNIEGIETEEKNKLKEKKR